MHLKYCDNEMKSIFYALFVSEPAKQTRMA